MSSYPRILCIYGNTVFYGHERSNIQVFKVLKELSVPFKVLINANGIHPEAKKILEENEIEHSPIKYPDWSDIRKPRTFQGWLNYISKVVQHNLDLNREIQNYKPDVLYLANDFMFINLLPTILFSNIKILYRIGDAPVMGWAPFRFFWKKVIIKRVTRFVYISEFIKRKVQAVGPRDSSKDVVIYNYPPTRSLEGKSEIPFQKLSFTFGYIGQIIQIKGVHLILESAKRLMEDGVIDFHVVIAGDLTYDTAYSDDLLQYVNENQLDQYVTFLGNIENIQDFFSKIDVLITPSIKEEPLGNVIVEAKSNAVPSIVFNSGGMPELIRDEIDGIIVKKKDSDSLKDSMLFFLEHIELSNIFRLEALKSMDKLSLNYSSFKGKWQKIILSISE